tara:strand:- start:5924 stop:6148 length:225 start_codon:yes stop_codon:yes gene_type:complete
MKTELSGILRSIDLDRYTGTIHRLTGSLLDEHTERIEIIFPARCSAYFANHLNCYVRVHGEWLEDGTFNVLRWV